jgi:uncharacterized protein with HEPN domain
MSERDRVYLRDMLDAAREALMFAEGQDRSRLESDRKLALALVMEIAIIREAAGRVSREVIESAPGIPWPKMVGMRNRLIHRYSGINRPEEHPEATAGARSRVQSLLVGQWGTDSAHNPKRVNSARRVGGVGETWERPAPRRALR